MSIQTNIELVRKHIPNHVDLVCVSKFHPDEAILDAYNAGERIFGESKVQELSGKYERLPKDIVWHFIGHLQTNKVKYIVDFVQLIHGVDSFKLLSEINKNAEKAGKTINCLLQVYIAQEETKFGFSESELMEVLNSESFKSLKNIRICGLMGMATFTSNKDQIRNEFGQLKTTFDKIKLSFFANDDCFRTISMGMSDDFQIAIEQGSTMVRIGSIIFGNRTY